jgi:uncharacterized protein (TIGR02596 family)
MALKTTGKRFGKRGFTLVELLLVIAIGIIISTLSITSYSKVVASGLLTTTMQSVVGLLDQARETAISRNAYVEVRIYELPLNTLSPTSGALSQFRAMQLFQVTSTGYTQLSKIYYFPSPMIIQLSDGSNSGSTTDHSTLLNSSVDISLTPKTPGAWGTVVPPIGTAPSLPTYGSNYAAITFRFTPKGGLSLDNTKQWFFTLISSIDKLTGTLPSNYATIQIDGFNGKASYYRP